jgi:hypothetical protein
VKKFCNFVVQNMAVFVVLIAVVAVLEPWTLTWVAPRVAWMLGIVMFGMGMTLKVDDFKTICQRPRDVGIGVLCQFIIMPGAAWLLVKVFRLPPELAIGVILVGTCPGGTASNVITYLAKGRRGPVRSYDHMYHPAGTFGDAGADLAVSRHLDQRFHNGHDAQHRPDGAAARYPGAGTLITTCPVWCTNCCRCCLSFPW